MPKNKNNVQDSPGTSDRGQLTASQSPYLPKQPPADPYVPPPSAMSLTGPELAQARAERALGYRAVAADILKDGDGTARIADAAEAAAAKVRRG
jgi:hypothetical protein